jgi:hypothetical protein
MSVGSVVPFARFVEYCRRRVVAAAANDAAADMAVSIEGGSRLEARENEIGGVFPSSTPARHVVEDDVDGEFGEDARS